MTRRKDNFVRSLAAYSLICYFFEVKDRHNGNILLDMEGNIVHIDFGFILGIAPGGSWSLETAPFKLTPEMVDVMGGLDSPLFSEFVTTFCVGFLALREHESAFTTLVDITAGGSTFPCFRNRDVRDVVEKLKARFVKDLTREQTVRHCLELIRRSVNSGGTARYDKFQWLTNGIMQ